LNQIDRLLIELDFPRINILAMAKSLTQPELKQYNTNGLLDTNSWSPYADRVWGKIFQIWPFDHYSLFRGRKLAKTWLQCDHRSCSAIASPRRLGWAKQYWVENSSTRLKKRNPTTPKITLCWVSLRQPNLQ